MSSMFSGPSKLLSLGSQVRVLPGAPLPHKSENSWRGICRVGLYAFSGDAREDRLGAGDVDFVGVARRPM